MESQTNLIEHTKNRDDEMDASTESDEIVIDPCLSFRLSLNKWNRFL